MGTRIKANWSRKCQEISTGRNAASTTNISYVYTVKMAQMDLCYISN